MGKKKKGKNIIGDAYRGKIELATTADDMLFIGFPDEKGKVVGFGRGLIDAVEFATNIVDLVEEHQVLKLTSELKNESPSAKMFDLMAERVKREGEHERTD